MSLPVDDLDFSALFGTGAPPAPEPDPFGRIGAGDPAWEAARGAWMEGAPLGRLFGDRVFDLNDTVGTGQANQRGDVFKLQALLHREGALDAEATGGPTGYWGNRDDAALRDFQKANGLGIDGWAGPGGETIRGLKRGYDAPVRLAQAGSGSISDAAPPVPAVPPVPAMPAVLPSPQSKPAAPPAAAAGDPWPDSPIHPDFRAALHQRESGGAAGQGYDAENSGAYGRYQMRMPALRDAGLVDQKGNWTGKYGVRSLEDFKSDPKAQEQAFADFMLRTEHYLKQIDAPTVIGKQVEGVKATFPITEAGLIAAAHRQGAGMVQQYIKYQEEKGWQSNAFKDIPKDIEIAIRKMQPGVSADKVLASVETRLREFSGIPYRPAPKR